MAHSTQNARLTSLHVLIKVLQEQHSLSECLPPALDPLVDSRDRALAQALCYGVLRYLPYLQALLTPLLRKPFKAKDRDVEILLLMGIYQQLYTRIPPHAAIAETVQLTRHIQKNWATGLANGVLRGFQRQREQLIQGAEKNLVAVLAHPRWWLDKLQADWGDRATAIAQANNQAPPMTVRVNARHHSRAAYLQQLQAQGIAAEPTPHTEHGLTLAQAMDVQQLPGFAEGWVSVQDGAAQLAAELLAVPEGARVLDACAAPGGKTAHILERYRPSELIAVDLRPERTEKIVGTLQRLHFSATICCADASCPAEWWDGQLFDRILLDVPCSASGVIRRHPDIKYLRQPADISALAQQQAALLHAIWPLLAPGGRLLYVTCSVFAEENQVQLQHFLAQEPTANAEPLRVQWGHTLPIGRQILPGDDNLDGFYYACLVKTV